MSGGKVVVTGAEGVVATAVERALRGRGFEVVRVVRGGDLDTAIAGAKAVVVLDAARRVAPADYEVALGAVALAVRDAPVERVVTATQWQGKGRARDLFAEVAKRAERGLAAVGVELARIRFGLLVGTPDADGPFDDALFERESRAQVPGDGHQLLRPLLIDDFAKIVAASVTADLGDEALVLAEGPEQVKLEALLDLLRIADRTASWHRVEDAFKRAAWRLSSAVHQLPAGDLLLRDEAPPTEILGVRPRSVPAIWTDAALEERPQRRQQTLHGPRYRIPRWAYEVTALLVTLGLLSVAVGVHDLLVVTTLGGWLIGLGLVLVGALGMIGGVGLSVTRWQPRYVIAFLASAILLATLAAILIATWMNGDVAWWWLIWVALGVMLVRACLRIWQLGNVEIADFMRTSVKVVGSILAAGVAVTVVQFLYSAVYVPAAATPTVNVDVALEPGEDIGRRMRAVDVVVTLKNESRYPVNVLGGNYRLDGARVEPAAARPAGQERRAWATALLAGEPASSGVERVGKRRLDRGILLHTGVLLEPEERIERRVVAHVPAGLDVLSLSAQLAVARPRFRGVSAYAFEVRPHDAGPVAVEVARIDDTSLLQQMIRTSRYVHVVHALGRSSPASCGLPGLVAYIDDGWETDLDGLDCLAIDQQKADHYGLTYTEAYTELHMANDEGAVSVKAPARRTTAGRS